ncbi:cyclase [Penicillium mononematosum]|uniref:cyclase n=1 Tax=Penicillium mononematosum TaxID=268346 RepID=UPI00254684B4|nr:cyclase [Penicillium mononematosum]KAJ6188137.1 cyclase [Penicillium mononematosum]
MSVAVTHIADLIPMSISYAHSHGISYDQFSSFHIGVIELQAVAASQGITFQAGDILLIRFETLGQMTGAEKAAAMTGGTMCGLDGSKEMARWLRDRHFAAVASDNMAVEAMSPIIDGVEQPTLSLCCISGVLVSWVFRLMSFGI